jgi:hypothetical protein
VKFLTKNVAYDHRNKLAAFFSLCASPQLFDVRFFHPKPFMENWAKRCTRKEKSYIQAFLI